MQWRRNLLQHSRETI